MNTNIYRPIPDSNNHDALFFKRTNDYEIFNQFTGNSMQNNWRSIAVDVDRRGKKGDYPSLYGYHPILSNKAVEALSFLSPNFVEFLPLLSDPVFYAMNVLNVIPCLDINSSDIEYFDDSDNILDIHTFVFNVDLLNDQLIFKIPELINEYFVSEDFKMIWNEYNLKGLIFEKVYSI